MSKAGTKTAKRAKPFAAEHEVVRAIAAEPAKPITKRRIALAACCGAALLAALATMPAHYTATGTSQVAAVKPAPIIRTSRTALAADAWAQIRPEDATGAISKKKKKSGKTKYMKAAEEPNAIGDWFKKTFGGDDRLIFPVGNPLVIPWRKSTMPLLPKVGTRTPVRASRPTRKPPDTNRIIGGAVPSPGQYSTPRFVTEPGLL